MARPSFFLCSCHHIAALFVCTCVCNVPPHETAFLFLVMHTFFFIPTVFSLYLYVLSLVLVLPLLSSLSCIIIEI